MMTLLTGFVLSGLWHFIYSSEYPKGRCCYHSEVTDRGLKRREAK